MLQIPDFDTTLCAADAPAPAAAVADPLAGASTDTADTTSAEAGETEVTDKSVSSAGSLAAGIATLALTAAAVI